MSQYRDLIARMAVDAEFAAHARAHPDEVAAQYGLTADETRQLRGLADAAASAGPIALGARLSKSGISTGLLTGFVVAQPDSDPAPISEVYKPVFDPEAPSGADEPTPPPPPPPPPPPTGNDYLSNILANQNLELLQEDDGPPKPHLPDHIDLDEILPALPDNDPPDPPAPVDTPAPVDPPAPPPPPPATDPVSNPNPATPATPTAPASPVTDVTSPPADIADAGEAGAPLQVAGPTTDTPGGTATPPSAFTATGESAGDGGIGATEIAIGAAGLVAGAVAGGVAGAVAGKSLGGSAADADDEKTMQGLGPAPA